MRKSNLFSAVLSLFLLITASITWAQTISSQKGLTTAIFTTSKGNIKVYLPDDIRPGDIISGTIVAESSGKNLKQAEKNLVELSKYSIGLNGEKFPINKDKVTFRFLVHSDRKLQGPIELLNGSGIKAAELIIPETKEQEPASAECVIPSHAMTGSPLRITGPFDGNSSNTNCTLNNKPTEILAESPRQCIVSYPAEGGGMNRLSVQETNKQPCTGSVSGVNMDVSAGKLNLRKGEKTYISVTITGLQNLPDTAKLTLDNTTRDVVTMTPSNIILIPLSPDSVGSGIFNRRFDIQSIRTGSFIVNVNLDLPETSGYSTGTQPGNSQSSCECIADVSISLSASKPGEKKYSATVTAECKGVYGRGVNTFIKCDVAKKVLIWSISDGKDNAEIEGDATGSSVTIKEKNDKPYTVRVTLTVTCTDGGTCEDSDEMPIRPTTTEEPKCECHADCAIVKAETRKGEVSYAGKVTAECIGNCSVAKITYKWHIGESGKDVAEIDGLDYAPGVTVKIKKPGPYNIYLSGTVTCTAGPPCEFHCSWEEPYYPPTTTSEFCKRDIIELTEPKMDGGLKINEVFPAKRIIQRDDFIALGAEGADFDMLKITCDPIPECKDDRSEILVPLSGRVGFKWEITNGKGRFVKLGCLFTKKGNDQKDEGEHVIFMPPVVPLPVLSKDTSVKTTVTLTIIDEKKDNMNDGQFDRKFEIVTRRSIDEPDIYKVEILYKDKHILPKAPTETKPKGSCEAKHGPWEKKADLGKPTIILPDVEDNDKMVLGQWMVLTADNQTDKDILKEILCKSGKKCATEPPVDKEYEDNVQWEWDQRGSGRLLTGRLGRYIIYEAPTKMAEGKQEMESIIKVRVYNPDELMANDKEQWSAELKIRIYQPGIQMLYPASDWVPTENNSAALTSELKYKKDNKWEPALAHMCRIHFFELLNVSEEKGVCLNDPDKDKANKCRDLQFKNEAANEAYEAVKPDKAKCTLTDQYMKVRTQEPMKNYTINVHSLDYGSYGLLKSLAKLETSTADNLVNTVEYISIPWTNAAVKHLNGRAKKIEYKDNRVNIPYDIDENQIPDTGWITFMKILVPDPSRNNADEDDKPRGDGFDGDGLTNYEEYRGFKVQQKKTVTSGTEAVEVKEAAHVRTNNSIKDIFIRNKHDLPIDLYKKITGLEVLEINDKQYQSDDIRVINYNFNVATHVVDQKGLYLYDGKKKKSLLGKAYSVTAQPARPNDEDSIVIYLEGVKENVDKINKMVDDYNKDPVKVKKFGGKFQYLNLEDKKAAVIAHELLHGNNVCHHGEGDEAVENSHDMVNGLRSGDVTCVMRYDNTGTKIADTAYFPEKPGTSLCTSPVGTSYNKPVIIKRNNRDVAVDGGYGNCAPGRGNCAGQIRISGVGERPPPCPKLKK